MRWHFPQSGDERKAEHTRRLELGFHRQAMYEYEALPFERQVALRSLYDAISKRDLELYLSSLMRLKPAQRVPYVVCECGREVDLEYGVGRCRECGATVYKTLPEECRRNLEGHG